MSRNSHVARIEDPSEVEEEEESVVQPLIQQPAAASNRVISSDLVGSRRCAPTAAAVRPKRGMAGVPAASAAYAVALAVVCVSAAAILWSGAAAPPPPPAPSGTTGNADDWTYEDPSSWPGTCNTGVAQSPINVESKDAQPAPEDFTFITRKDFEIVGDDIVNDFSGQAVTRFNGHAVTIDSVDAYMDWSGATFQLKQFHYHTPSEHQIDGQQFDAEMHFFFQSLSGSVMVMAVMVREGATSPDFVQEIVEKTVQKANSNMVIELDYGDLLKDIGLHKKQETGYLSYAGSLTTPPCTEGVQWVLIDTGMTVKKEHIVSLSKLEKHNVRPLQPLNGRTVYSKQTPVIGNVTRVAGNVNVKHGAAPTTRKQPTPKATTPGTHKVTRGASHKLTLAAPAKPYAAAPAKVKK